MKNNRLLICIAFHYNEKRIGFLKEVIDCFNLYKIDHSISIDTNSKLSLDIDFLKQKNISINVHENLDHPYHLTHTHRSFMYNNLENYDWFMYVEDDMVVPYNNFIKFIEKFNNLWPEYIPGFIRVEKYHSEQSEEYSPDIMIDLVNDMVLEVKGEKYVKIPFHYNYSAFWILPKNAIKDSIKSKTDSIFLAKPTAAEFREHCASFAIWTLNTPSLLSINKEGKLDRSCISYHVANNYSHSSKKLNDIWKLG